MPFLMFLPWVLNEIFGSKIFLQPWSLCNELAHLNSGEIVIGIVLF